MQIIVLGMHRSGTSLATRLINMMGAWLGHPEALLPANPDNPEGFWERRDVIGINRDLLHRAGCSWYAVANFPENGLPLPAPEPIRRGIRAVAAELNANRPWALKDPRLCLTLPTWLPELGETVAVIAWREPLEAARSLQLRNGMPMEYGLALWEAYATHLVRNAAAMPKVFVRHDEVIAAPFTTAEVLFDALSVWGVEGLSLPGEETIKAFIKPGLQRARQQDTNIVLSSNQQRRSAMLQGKIPFDANIVISAEAKEILRSMQDKVSGAPVNR